MAEPTTPSRSRTSQQAPPTTYPRASRATSKPEFDSGLHDDRSKILLADTPRYQLPLPVFLNLLPRASAASQLDWSNILAQREYADRFDAAFAGLPGTPTYDSKRHEDEVFHGIHAVFDTMVQVCHEHRCTGPKLMYVSRPTRSPGNSTKPDGTKPDGQLCLPDSEPGDHGVYPWASTFGTAEYKRENTPKSVKDNDGKAQWGLGNQLWQVPDRLIAWAFTIEHSSVRWWIATRSGVYESSRFDMNEQRHHFLQGLSSLAYATDQELGWDTVNMDRPDVDTPLYKAAEQQARRFQESLPHEHGATAMRPLTITLIGARYLAFSLIADHRARGIEGSGCRVLAASKLNDDDSLNEKRYAIKIVWRCVDRLSEGKIYESIMSHPQHSSARPDDVQQYFVKIVQYQDFQDIHEKILNGIDVNQAVKIDAVSSSTTFRSESAGSLYSSSRLNSEAPGPREYTPVQNRVYSITVSEYAGRPMHHQFDRGKVTSAYIGILNAFRFLVRLKYNHRDGSPGNFMVDDKGLGRLGDLEFAKLFGGDVSTTGERTGTPHFMANEVYSRQYLFTKKASSEEPPPLRHNPGHDLESVFRTFLYQLLLTVNRVGGTSKQSDLQREAIHTFFGDKGRLPWGSHQPCSRLRKVFSSEPEKQVLTIIELAVVALHEAQGEFSDLSVEQQSAQFTDFWLPRVDAVIADFKKIGGLLTDQNTMALYEWRKREHVEEDNESSKKRRK
ncbi:hypothetical protein CALVIDRAFT_437938 [Calocera viscosa TUFC12733]|uniref:Protein kinase domain-containing protein n=1 Tax=Calocera viscosa (strain TUFC12733) TaxID=1330018 RepID=A0A167FTD6_CALVF|nr:hypothetical protein CALVIDRAFT_437938 [Calocera viscosa TUFC12733]